MQNEESTWSAPEAPVQGFVPEPVGNSVNGLATFVTEGPTLADVMAEVVALRQDLAEIKTIVGEAAGSVAPMVEKLSKNPILGGLFK